MKNPQMDELIRWLPESAPEDTVTSIVHGDYRIDNMIYHADRPQVAAVLDWELSTLGNPLADFSYLMMNWVMPSDQRSGLRDVNLEELGIPTVEEVVERYGQKTGRTDLGNVDCCSATICSGWRRSARESWDGCGTAPPTIRAPWLWKSACRCWSAGRTSLQKRRDFEAYSTGGRSRRCSGHRRPGADRRP
jgi:hypothetical protein